MTRPARRRWILLGAAAFAFGTTLAPARVQALVTIFTDRAAWTAAAGAATFSENFSGFAVDTPFHTVPVALNGMTISREGPEVSVANLVDVPPLMLAGSGTSQGQLFVNATQGTDFGTNIRITFAQLNRAFGFDVWGATGGEGARLDVLNGNTQLRTQEVPTGNAAFLGYVCTAGDSATSVLFRPNSQIVGAPGQAFAIDNLAGVRIPEPATVGQALIALAGLLAVRQRRLAA